MNMITSLGEWCDGQDPSVSLALWSLQFRCYCFLHDLYMFLRLWDYATPGYQRNTLCAIKSHNVTVSERYLWALSVIQHHKKLASKVTKELVTRWCITERVKRLAGNEIELGMKIPTIESRASNILMDKGNNVCCYAVWPIKIFVEYVGVNMSIQVPLLAIDRRRVSVMSA